jgi:bifunctional non-homologous end joining protein LigD
MNSTKRKSITLYFKQGSSDKVYQASIEQSADGYVVNFAYGRRGSTLTLGSKTQAAVELDAAEKIFDKLIKEKKAKGYTEGLEGTPYVATSNEERRTGYLPQLLNPIGEGEALKYITHTRFGAQEKYDGKRIMLIVSESEVVASNRSGLACGIPESVVEAARALFNTSGCLVLDGEMVGETYFTFDILVRDGDDLSGRSYEQRYNILKAYVGTTAAPIVRAELAISYEAKYQLVEQLRAEGREGVVFKDLDASYTAGRPNSGGSQLKLKFVDTCSALVTRHNAQRSVALSLFDETADDWTEVGNVTIPPNKAIPLVGAIVEVRYLYAYRGGSLFQPVYLGERDDIQKLSCTLLQLKYKAEAEAA